MAWPVTLVEVLEVAEEVSVEHVIEILALSLLLF
jgi:hypothetical protein